ncbi:membrane protein [Thalassospira xiamenensis]|uniref:OmpH family outer membrane protein n=1 Tax=Thalassospira xiamenensis TaxID=220697 RepID=UPI000DED9011|nr:OmpH family outer membrane protein [Thalassospira xiamenensis]RCK34362.1 membrane protein [Thalassospira xiamenensis]
MKMMKSIQTALLAIVLAFASVTMASAQENADGNTEAVVMIVDFEGIMREASAMQDMTKQIKTRQEAYQQEIEKRQQALRKEEQEIAQQRTLLSADVIQQKQKEFQQKVADFQKFAQGRNRILDEALNSSRVKFQKTLIEVIADVAEQRKATLVLHKSQVILHANAMDASKEVFDRVNKAMPTLSVEFKEAS